jgi:hypothetical protein
MKLSWKILLIGTLLITSFFSAYIGYTTINLRSTKQTELAETRNDFAPIAESSQQRKESLKYEAQTHRQLIRGTVTQFNQETNTFGVAIESKDTNGLLRVIGVIDVQFNPNVVTEFLCWPEYKETASGEPVDLKKSFISMGKDNFLYLSGETKESINDLNKYLEKSPYVFAYLSTEIEDFETILTGSENLEPQYLNQLAILGCNEN